MAAVKSRRQPGRESKKGQRYSHGIWIAWTPINQRWFLLQGKGPNDSIILDRFMTRAEAARAAERLTEKRGDENPWNEPNRDPARRRPKRRVAGRNPLVRKRQGSEFLGSARPGSNEQFYIIENRRPDIVYGSRFSTWKEAYDWGSKNLRGRQRWDIMEGSPGYGRRDPSNGKVTNLAAFRKKKEAATMSRETEAYERREVADFQRQLREVERLPLSERKENAQDFQHILQNEPEWVAERVGWLLNGSYGRGSYMEAQKVARRPRMNQGAWLVQTVAALEWSVPPRMTAQAWHTLSAAQRKELERLIQREIRDALSE